jgi:hypothetical protein
VTVEELVATFADELDEAPWLRVWVEDGDESLVEARQRFDECVREATVALRARGVEVRSLVVTADGVETTMLAPPPSEVTS